VVQGEQHIAKAASLARSREVGVCRPGLLRRTLARLGPDFTFLLLYYVALISLIVAYGASFQWNDGSITIPTAVLVGLVLFKFLHHAPSILRGGSAARGDILSSTRRMLRDWGPFIGMTFAFENLEPYSGIIRKISVDTDLYQLDLKVFGVEPTVWM